MKDFIFKNFGHIVLAAAVFVMVLLFFNRQNRLVAKATEYAALQSEYERICGERDNLKTEMENLLALNGKLKIEIDSIKAEQAEDKKHFQYILRKHEAEIDSLLGVPNDTVYARLQPIYPNTEPEPLLYPFSGGQIRQIYATAVSYPRLLSEYSLQTEILGNCEVLNQKYGLSAENYAKQVDNMAANLEICGEQISIKETELSVARKEAKNKSFWNWTYKGLLVAIGVLAIAK
jgi:hypothetical protein